MTESKGEENDEIQALLEFYDKLTKKYRKRNRIQRSR